MPTSPLNAPRRRELSDGWSLAVVDGPAPESIRGISVPATVPGSVHTDLLAARLIPDPYLDDNENLLAWIGVTDWLYSTSFDWQPDGAERTELVFGGLDTIATVALNGTVIARTRNMHRSHRIDVTGLLRPGANELTVNFDSPVRYADAASLELGYRPHVNHHPYNAIRKMACGFGWDWGIDTSSSGIWRPVSLESWSSARLAGVRPIATVDGSDGVVDVHVEVDRTQDGPLTLSATVGGIAAEITIAEGENSGMLSVRVPDIDLWWPRGYGAQPLYDLVVSLSDASGALDQVEKRVGFRSVEFDMTPDDEGTPFTLVVNGENVFVRGANWIPDDAFPHRVDRDRYRRRLEQAAFANLNLIRVWGGGIYESDDFYELCDELGMLTWQDFLLACAAYAEEDPLRSEIEAEAREAVARLAHHPSLVVLNGNNENVWGYEEWNWKLRLEGKTWGGGYYYELFPAIVAELAPHIGYTPGSPFSPIEGTRQNDPANGTMHIWDLWNQRDYPEYRAYEPRFVAEFGWQGPPTWSTLTSSIHDQPLTPESPGMLVHQKAMEGNVKLTDGLIPHLPLPNDMVDWHWAMSLNQANAITTAIEHFRSLQPHCMGSIVWQLNDCWPVTSWAAVDGYERPKPLLYALRHAYADRLVTVQPRDGRLSVIVVNDSGREWNAELTARRVDYDGTALAEHVESVVVPARSVRTVLLPAEVAETDRPAGELIVADVDGERGFWFFAEARDSNIPAPQLETVVERDGEQVTVRVTASTLIRDLSLLVDKVDADATVSDMLVTLLPGESVEFRFDSAAEFSDATLTSAEVLRSANQLVAR